MGKVEPKHVVIDTNEDNPPVYLLGIYSNDANKTPNEITAGVYRLSPEHVGRNRRDRATHGADGF